MQALEHQADAVAQIAARARAYFAGEWRGLAIKPRWHTLLVGPTGTGKTAVAHMVAAALNATTGTSNATTGTSTKILVISATGWIPAGAHQRGTKETIGVIASAVAANARTLLVADELDKITLRDNNGWQSYIRDEVMGLADGRWPAGLRMPDDSDEDGMDDATAMAILTAKLQSSVFILGVGTFQDWFDAPRRTIGFGGGDHDEPISGDVIAGLLPRELANRFGNIIRLPDLRHDDYARIAKQAEATLPERMRLAFREAAGRRIADAISAKKGVRFVEEAIMDVLTNPQEGLGIAIPQPSNSPQPTHTIDLCTL